jgi:hypothetical protein
MERADRRSEWFSRAFVLVFTPLTIAAIYAIVTAVSAPINVTSQPIAPPASPELHVHITNIDPTSTPSPTVTPSPTPPAWASPEDPECRPGVATPGAACKMIPVPPTMVPEPTLPPCVLTGATPVAYGNGECIW